MRGGKIRPNHNTEIPREMVFLDTEAAFRGHPTKPNVERQVLRLGVARYGRWESGRLTRRGVFEFRRARDFWDWLEARVTGKSSCWVWAHRLAYDFSLIEAWRMCEEQPERVERCILGDPPMVVTFKLPKGRATFVDSLNWFPQSLEKCGRELGLEKGPIDFRACSEGELWDHCRTDAEILERLVCSLLSWCQERNAGCLRFTAAGQALQILRHRWPETLPTVHNCKIVNDLERRAIVMPPADPFYVGEVIDPTSERPEVVARRTELVMDAEVGSVTRADCNGLFPYAMGPRSFPVRLVGYGIPAGPLSLYQQGRRYATIADVALSTDRPYPYRRAGKEVIWAVGRFTTTLAGPELQSALDAGEVVGCGLAAWYDAAEPFGGFADWYWSERLRCRRDGLKVWESAIKWLGNSLWGKFCQQNQRWEASTDVSPGEAWRTWPENLPGVKDPVLFRSIGYHVQRLTGVQEGQQSFPAISAFTTTYARQHVDRARNLAGERNVFYQGVDCLHLSPEGLRNLCTVQPMHADHFGHFRVEKSTDYACYFSHNHYQWGEETVAAGLPRQRHQLEDGSWEVQKFETLHGLIRRSPDASVHVTTERIRLEGGYNRGTVGADGWVRPLVLDERHHPRVPEVDAPNP